MTQPQNNQSSSQTKTPVILDQAAETAKKADEIKKPEAAKTAEYSVDKGPKKEAEVEHCMTKSGNA